MSLSTRGHKGSGAESGEGGAVASIYRTFVELAAEVAVLLLVVGIIAVLNFLLRLTIGNASSRWTWIPIEILDAVTLLAGCTLAVDLVGRSLWKVYKELSREDAHKAPSDD